MGNVKIRKVLFGVLFVFMSIVAAVPALAIECKEDGAAVCLEPIESRVTAGATFVSGLNDPSWNVASNLPNYGVVFKYNGNDLLECGAVTGAVTGAAGENPSPNSQAFALGGSCYVLKWLQATAAYAIDSSAPESSRVAFINLDQRAFGYVSDLIKAGFGKVPAVPIIMPENPVAEPAPQPAAYLPSFSGLNDVTWNDCFSGRARCVMSTVDANGSEIDAGDIEPAVIDRSGAEIDAEDTAPAEISAILPEEF